MSGWQRIGVAISILWFVGLPLYVISGTNGRAQSDYLDCMISTHGYSDLAAANSCAHVYDISVVYFSKVFFENPDAGWAWGAILVPIALLWIVGDAILGTLRWVGRGLKGA